MSSPLLAPNLERFLDLTAQREQVVSVNMANVDTPGYHAKEATFAQTLQLASDTETPTAVRIRDEGGLMERADGNDVDIDRESLLLAKAQLQYAMGVQLIKDQFHEELSAINGGGNS